MENINRGSEWRKWDLHFHTPSSYDYKDASVTNECIIKELIDNNISVVAITDHHLIDIERINQLKTIAGDKINILVGIEFLSDSRGKQPIHFIGIFSEKCDLSYIWGQIENRTSIKKIRGEGKKVNEVYCDLTNTINLIHELGGLVSIHAGGKHSSVENITHCLPHGEAQKTDIAFAVDIYELGSESDQIGYRQYVFPSIKKEIPMIICSDNHNVNKYDIKENCWIKAEPTFEGLKQIIYEPERVKIQKEKPEIKTSYEVIKSIKIIDPTNTFTTKKIGLNNNLNSIIGGKSSGKSLLLYLLAKTILPKEKFEEIKKYKNFVEYDNLSQIDCEVEWEDGIISKLLNDESKRYIDYIPQMHLNNIAEDKEKNTSFKQTIDELLHKKHEYTNILKSLDMEISEHRKILNNEIDKYFNNEKELKRLESELIPLGDKSAIELSIKRYKDELKILKSKSSLTPEDEVQIKSINESISEKNNEKILLSNQIILLTKIKKLFDNLDIRIDNFINEEFLNIETTLENKNILDEIKNKLSKEFKLTIHNFKITDPIDIETLNCKIINLDNEITKLSTSLEPYNEKFDDKKKFLDTQKYLFTEEEKLNKILQKEIEIKLQEEKLDLSIFISKYEELFNSYKKIIVLNEPYKNIGTDLELITEIKFNIEKFSTNFSNFITKNLTLDKQFNSSIFTSKNIFLYDFDNHINNINFIMTKLFDKNISFNQNKTIKEMIIYLFDDYFDVTYDLKQGIDKLEHMSPGKKGIILFQLFLEISSSKIPILIDQPEDNLDNRTVYNTLTEFIKNKKIDRQIIMVSHNSNLVVSTDSENIIVANQNGQKEGTVKFDYINGALENSFKNTSQHISVLESQGIREHVCEILEGGEIAFKKREKKYNLK